MPKVEKGQLDIEIFGGGGCLFIRLTDNGIGREQAAAVRNRSGVYHESAGLKITAQRIAMLQQATAKQSAVTINDLVDADGSAAGTEVIIQIPMLYD
jgi:hypothetical protein